MGYSSRLAPPGPETLWKPAGLGRRPSPVMRWGRAGEASHLLLWATIGSQVPQGQALSESVLISNDTKYRVIDDCNVFPFR